MDDIANPRRRAFFELTGVRLRLWPILLAAVIMQLGLVMAPRAAGLQIITAYPGFFQHHAWASLMLVLVLQTLIGLLGIAAMWRLVSAADPCLRWPPARSYAGVAVAIGVAMAIVMLIADYWPSLLVGMAPDSPFPITSDTAVGWFAALSITGVAEEIGFRGLLVGMLTALVPGRVRAGRFEIPLSGVIVGLLFGAAHYQSFIYLPLHFAIAQFIYAFAWSLVFVWLMEQSRSLLAPIIAHSVSDVVEVGIVFLLMVVWG
jgi:membrane protease YdiL (CAAX protease family)